MTYCSFCMEPIQPTYKVCPHCGKPTAAEIPAHHLLPGTILHEKFLVGAALGEGGFGITYIGRDLTLDIKVAIKEFYPSGYVNRSNTATAQVTCSISEEGRDIFEKGRERFLREARILAKFSSDPGVVEVRDFFEANNTAYIIMEYLDGADLKQMMRTGGPMAPGRVIELMMPVMRTLTKIHSQGLIHRDISPDNIRMCRGSAKLLDFGAARDVSSVANKSLSVMLKPGFAPEEQYRSRGNQGAWTDVYALCATMYACITGVTPDDATQRVFNDEVKRPSEMGVVIGPAVENAIMKGMAVKQEDRFRSVEELMAALTGSAPAPAPARTPVQPKASAPASRKKKGGRGILIALIAILLAAAVGVGAYFIMNGDWGGDRDEDPETTGTSSSGEPGSLNEQNRIEFTLDGEQYAIPCTFADLADKGWSVYTYSDIDVETVIPAMTYTFGSLEKNGETVSVLVYNDTDGAKAVKDCEIGNMYLDLSDFALVLPEGLSGLPTVDEIITALGDPDLRDDGDGYTSLTYYLDGIQGKYYDFYCDLEDPEYSSLSISNMNTVDFNYVLPEDLEGDGTDDTTDTPTDVPDTEPSSEDATVSTPDEPSVPAGVMSDNLLDFTFKLDGKVYRLPCDYTELTSDGWTISYGGTEDQQIPSRSYVYLTMVKNGATFTAYVYNLSGNAKTLKDCKVGFIDFHSDAGIELAKGITPLSTKEEVIAAFGTPSKEAAYDNYVRLEYTVDGKPDTFVKFYCYTERTELFSRIEIKNFIVTESDKTETNSDVPAYLASYVAPTALGNDMSSGIISFGGDLYHLPAPLTEFTDNGWVITAKTNDVASGVTESVKLERDGKSFTVYVKNFADYQTIPENCAVVSLLSYASYDVEMTLPGNIGLGSSAEEVAAAPLPEGITNNDGFYTYYNYTGDENYSLAFRVDKNSGLVSYITISDKNWDH